MWPGTPSAALLAGDLGLGRPAVLAVLAAVGLALLVRAWVRGPIRVGVPAGRPRRGRHGMPDLAFPLSALLRCVALTLLGVALAGPFALLRETPAGGEGIDLIVALDASGSMNALDATLEGRRVTRFELARRVVADFVRAREGDRVGLVVFGEKAFTQCPLTVDRRLVLDALQRAEVGVAGDATALGEAIGLGVRRLRIPGAPEEGRRVLLLLTDGRHNAGTLGPETAARIARLRSVRVHAIGIGTTGSVPFARSGPGEPVRFERVDLDADTLRSIARATGGEFFHARRPEDLAAVAAAIDRLEVAPHAGESRYRRVSISAGVLWIALLLLLLEAVTAHGVLRRLP